MNKQTWQTCRLQSRCGQLLYWVVLALFLIPVAVILSGVLLNRQFGKLLIDFLASPSFGKTLRFSVTEALLSAGFSLILALPGAYFFGRYNFAGKRYWQSAMVLPFMLPGILVVLGLVTFYGQNGFVNTWLTEWFPGFKLRFTGLYGFWGIVLANVFYNFCFCIRILGESWERIDLKLLEVAGTLGSSRWDSWVRIVLPLLLPTIGYLFVLVFLYSFLGFTVVLVLGGYLYKTFEVLIYIEYNNKLNFDLATVIVIVQGVLLALILYLQYFFNRRVRVQAMYCQPQIYLNWKTAPLKTGILACYLGLISIYFLSPLLAILIRSLYRYGRIGNALTGENYLLLFSDRFTFAVGQSFGQVVINSLLLAGGVALITTAAAYGIARSRRSRPWNLGDLWLQLPMGISFITFTLGLARLGGFLLPAWLLIAWAQFFLAFPLVYSIIRTAWREVGESILEAALLLGAEPKQLFFSIELPLMCKAIITAWSYAVAFSLGDLAAVLMLGKGEITTLSVAIYRLIGHYHFPLATALGVIFIILSLLIYALSMDWIKSGGSSHPDVK